MFTDLQDLFLTMPHSQKPGVGPLVPAIEGAEKFSALLPPLPTETPDPAVEVEVPSPDWPPLFVFPAERTDLALSLDLPSDPSSAQADAALPDENRNPLLGVHEAIAALTRPTDQAVLTDAVPFAQPMQTEPGFPTGMAIFALLADTPSSLVFREVKTPELEPPAFTNGPSQEAGVGQVDVPSDLPAAIVVPIQPAVGRALPILSENQVPADTGRKGLAPASIERRASVGLAVDSPSARPAGHTEPVDGVLRDIKTENPRAKGDPKQAPASAIDKPMAVERSSMPRSQMAAALSLGHGLGLDGQCFGASAVQESPLPVSAVQAVAANLARDTLPSRLRPAEHPGALSVFPPAPIIGLRITGAVKPFSEENGRSIKGAVPQRASIEADLTAAMTPLVGVPEAKTAPDSNGPPIAVTPMPDAAVLERDLASDGNRENVVRVSEKAQEPTLPAPDPLAGQISVPDLGPSQPVPLEGSDMPNISPLGPGVAVAGAAASVGHAMPTAHAPVAAQVADAFAATAVSQMPDRIEITLAPDTLGRVHFDMQMDKNGLSITISAERPETLDLIRRNLPDLVGELHQAGIDAGSFQFGGWHDRNDPKHQTPDSKADLLDVGPTAVLPPRQPQPSGVTGQHSLHLRL